jgi:hypothetical protein
MLSRLLVVILGACGGAPVSTRATPSPAATCNPLQIKAEHYQLTASTAPTTGFDLRGGTQPVGIIADRDGSSVWLLGTGGDTVMHVTASGAASAYALPHSGLGIQIGPGCRRHDVGSGARVLPGPARKAEAAGLLSPRQVRVAVDCPDQPQLRGQECVDGSDHRGRG